MERTLEIENLFGKEKAESAAVLLGSSELCSSSLWFCMGTTRRQVCFEPISPLAMRCHELWHHHLQVLWCKVSKTILLQNGRSIDCLYTKAKFLSCSLPFDPPIPPPPPPPTQLPPGYSHLVGCWQGVPRAIFSPLEKLPCWAWRRASLKDARRILERKKNMHLRHLLLEQTKLENDQLPLKQQLWKHDNL